MEDSAWVDKLLLGMLFITFLVLKLTNVVSWSWWWVFAPLWMPFAFALLIIICVWLYFWFLKVFNV